LATRGMGKTSMDLTFIGIAAAVGLLLLASAAVVLYLAFKKDD
jgi:hypothetical protein